MPEPKAPDWLIKKIEKIPITEPSPIVDPKVDPWETDPNTPKPEEKEEGEVPPGEAPEKQ